MVVWGVFRLWGGIGPLDGATSVGSLLSWYPGLYGGTIVTAQERFNQLVPSPRTKSRTPEHLLTSPRSPPSSYLQVLNDLLDPSRANLKVRTC